MDHNRPRIKLYYDGNSVDVFSNVNQNAETDKLNNLKQNARESNINIIEAITNYSNTNRISIADLNAASDTDIETMGGIFIPISAVETLLTLEVTIVSLDEAYNICNVTSKKAKSITVVGKQCILLSFDLNDLQTPSA